MKIFYIFLPLILCGCSTNFGKLYKDKNSIKQDIENLESKSRQDLALKEEQIKNKFVEILSAKEAQIQQGANAAYAADNAFRFYSSPSRLDIIINNRVKEFMAAMGVGPTLKAIQEENERLLRELDEKVTSIDKLRNINSQKIKENEILVAETTRYNKDLEKLKIEKDRIKEESTIKLSEANKQLDKINDDLLIAQNTILEKEKEKSSKIAYIEKNKQLLMIGLGILSLVGLAGAIWSPVFKKELGQFAGICGGITLAIPFIQPIHFAVIFGLGLIYIGFLVVRKHKISDRISTNLVNFVEDVKTDKPEIFEKELKSKLIDWNTKYTKNGDKTEDKEVVNEIDNILRDYERK